jgi:hypothetical protein
MAPRDSRGAPLLHHSTGRLSCPAAWPGPTVSRETPLVKQGSSEADAAPEGAQPGPATRAAPYRLFAGSAAHAPPRLQSSHGSRRCTCGRGAPRVCGGGVLVSASPPSCVEVLHLRTETAPLGIVGPTRCEEVRARTSTGVTHTRQTWEQVRCFPHARRRARKDAARSALGRGAPRTREVGGRPCIPWTLSVREARPTHRHRAEVFLGDRGRKGCLAHASLRGVAIRSLTEAEGAGGSPEARVRWSGLVPRREGIRGAPRTVRFGAKGLPDTPAGAPRPCAVHRVTRTNP